eukprot:687421-Amphidinium_carterae.1
MKVVCIACGNNHSIAVCQTGRAYEWGAQVDTPQHTRSPIELLPWTMVACSDRCNVSASEAVKQQGPSNFGWKLQSGFWSRKTTQRLCPTMQVKTIGKPGVQ